MKIAFFSLVAFLLLTVIVNVIPLPKEVESTQSGPDCLMDAIQSKAASEPGKITCPG